MRRILVIAACGLATALALAPAGAHARAGGSARSDRNHDRLPDRWERRHRLSLRVKQGSRDQDRDGLRNLGEYRAGTDPRDRDSDDDGLRDGAEVRYGLGPRDRDSDDDGVGDRDEHAGSIVSFQEGVLTIALAGGGTVSGRVTGVTKVECVAASLPKPKARAFSAPHRSATAHAASGDESPVDDLPGDELEVDLPGEDDDPGERSPGTGEDDAPDGEDAGGCSAADLVAGARVREASLKLADGVAVFREVELLR